MPATRRLVAVLHADVSGVSRMMAEDVEATRERIRAYLSELTDKIREHQGRSVRFAGDGVLAEFPSVVDAVRCAVEFQRGMVEREPEVPDERRIRFRIRLNLGDVIVEEHEIYGDGVNIAARLAEIAEPGGLYISEEAFRQVRGNVAADFVEIGARPLRNIARPVRVYSADLAAAAEPPATKPPGLSISGSPPGVRCDARQGDGPLRRHRWACLDL